MELQPALSGGRGRYDDTYADAPFGSALDNLDDLEFADLLLEEDGEAPSSSLPDGSDPWASQNDGSGFASAVKKGFVSVFRDRFVGSSSPTLPPAGDEDPVYKKRKVQEMAHDDSHARHYNAPAAMDADASQKAMQFRMSLQVLNPLRALSPSAPSGPSAFPPSVGGAPMPPGRTPFSPTEVPIKFDPEELAAAGGTLSSMPTTTADDLLRALNESFLESNAHKARLDQQRRRFRGGAAGAAAAGPDRSASPFIDDDERESFERDSRRREIHASVERKRRDNINDCIGEFARIVPPDAHGGDNAKLSKGLILRRAVDYLETVLAANQTMEEHLGVAVTRWAEANCKAEAAIAMLNAANERIEALTAANEMMKRSMLAQEFIVEGVNAASMMDVDEPIDVRWEPQE